MTSEEDFKAYGLRLLNETMGIWETPGEPQKKINKTPAQDIQKASDRYYENKNEILRNKAINNIKKSGALPLRTTMEKHGISWEDIARVLAKDQGRNSKNPRPTTKKLLEEA